MRTDGSDGGPAYPNSVQPDFQYAEPGMSLRDWFAGMALAHATREIWAEHKFENVAERAYLYADAMLKARAK